MRRLSLVPLAMAIGDVAVAFTASTLKARCFPRNVAAGAIDSPVVLSVSNSNDEKEAAKEGGEESEEELQRRMAVVRSLQMSFYGSSASKRDRGTNEDENGAVGNDEDGPPRHDVSTGTIQRLPLFRAAWYELPGRSNVLILKDPIYTNMFEKMFYTSNNNNNNNNKIKGPDSDADTNSISPWVFGHLFTPNEHGSDKATSNKKNLFKKKGDSSAKKASSEGGSAAPKQNGKRGNKDSKRNRLLNWKDSGTNRRGNSPLSSTAVLGTLMYVRDYRRLRDGRILALVHAAETFVVEKVHRSLPYAIVDARILPDVEELEFDPPATDGSESLPSPSIYSCGDHPDEQFLVDSLRADEDASAGPARARAVEDSIHVYHRYECDSEQRLDGIPNKSDLGILDITHNAISRAHLPYCPFAASSFLNATTAAATTTTRGTTPAPRDETGARGSSPSEKDPARAAPSLEFELLRRGITKIPPSDRRFSYNAEPTYASSSSEETKESTTHSWTTDELEYELWLVLDYFLKATKKEISPVLLRLLPSEPEMPRAWPPGFSLKAAHDTKHGNSQGDPGRSSGGGGGYPHRRRQRRLSYSAAYLLEAVLPIGRAVGSGSGSGVRCSGGSGVDEAEIQELRALLLSVPSTRQRLRVVLERFHRWRLYEECDEFA